MTNYRNLKLWLGFLILNGFPRHVAQPTEQDVAHLRKEYPDLPEEELLVEFATQAMLDYTNPRAWISFLRKHRFPTLIPQPREEDISDIQKYYPKLDKKEVLLKYAEQNECPDLDYTDFERSVDPHRHTPERRDDL